VREWAGPRAGSPWGQPDENSTVRGVMPPKGPAKGRAMEIAVDSLECIGCRICEYACNYHHDGDCAAIGASLMLHRAEKKNYFGMMIKRERNLLLARPEGPEIVAPGEQAKGAGASSKPILMRAPCDGCRDEPGGPLCIKVCPTRCLSALGG